MKKDPFFFFLILPYSSFVASKSKMYETKNNTHAGIFATGVVGNTGHHGDIGTCGPSQSDASY